MDAKERCAETVPPDGMRKSDAPNGAAQQYTKERLVKRMGTSRPHGYRSLDDTLNRTQNAIPLAYSALP